MHTERTAKTAKSNRADVQVRFSPRVRSAFADLAAAVHFTDNFDPDIRTVLAEWGSSDTLSASDVLIAFPAIAQEVFSHIQAAGDQRANEAWEDLRNQIAENGFTFSMRPARGR
jgi:hypothetical protein